MRLETHFFNCVISLVRTSFNGFSLTGRAIFWAEVEASGYSEYAKGCFDFDLDFDLDTLDFFVAFFKSLSGGRTRVSLVVSGGSGGGGGGDSYWLDDSESVESSTSTSSP